jgi:Leucine-rich repeat (LRR) protein
MRGAGEIPASIGNLTGLVPSLQSAHRCVGVDPAIHLREIIRGAGEIPASIGNLTKLKKLGLQENQLTGAQAIHL